MTLLVGGGIWWGNIVQESNQADYGSNFASAQLQHRQTTTTRARAQVQERQHVNYSVKFNELYKPV